MRKGSIVYSDELAKEICDTISESYHGLKYLCDRNPHWPYARTIYRWLEEKPLFKDMYTRAKDHQIESLVAETLDISSNESRDLITQTDGTLMTNPGAINRDKLKIDIIKWQAACLKPMKYGNNPKQPQSSNDFLSANRDEINSSDE